MMNTLTQQAKQSEEAVGQGHSLRSELKKQLSEGGCFSPAPGQQISHMVLVVILYAGGYAALLLQPTVGVRITALILLAFSSVQAGYIAHEAGHGAITRKRWLARSIGQFFNTFLTALCYSHFQKIHTCHHAHCNERDKDIDMQSNLVSLYPQAVNQKRTRAGRYVTRYQAFLLWPLVCLQGFTLKIDSLHTLRKKPQSTRVDQIVLILHLLLWFGLPVIILGPADALINYTLMTWFIGPYLGSVFLVNHIGTRVIGPDENMSYFNRRLITTRNLGDSRIEDIFFGGLNNHIEHHLFPSIPSARLGQARIIVREFCHQHNLPYLETSWCKAVGEVFTYLNHISQRA